MAQYALGIDIGGTFTDIVVYDQKRAVSYSHKELTTPESPHRGVISGIRRLFEAERLEYRDVARMVHATTLFTNALIERKGAPTGLVTTEGFRDILEMRREHKYELYDLFIELPEPLVPRRLRLEVPERIGADGGIEMPLDEETLLERVRELVRHGVQSLAVSLLHAYANPVHERRARALIEREFPKLFVSLSSDVAPQIREYERTSTTVVNAYIKPLAESYLAQLASELARLGIKAPLFMMLSSGGLTHIAEAKRVPVQLLESGPAAGALAGALFGRRSGVGDVLAFDMGGTTAKLAMVEEGEPLIAYQFEASRAKRFAKGSGFPISISTIELIEIGAGGGSISEIDALGLLKVGPRSAGAAPGPACYGRGGKDATVTDANLELGFLDPSTFAGGTMKIDRALAAEAIKPLAAKSALAGAQLAWGIHSVVNENMAAAARVHVAERGRHASEFALLVTGGGGPLHGCEVAKRLGIRRVICPPSAGVASALGLLMAPARVDRVATLARRLGKLDWGAFERAFRELERDARTVIDATLPGKPKVSVERAADLRFVGQGFELVTPLPKGPYTPKSLAAIRQAFVREYRRVFRQVPLVSDIEIINIRVALTAKAGRTELKVHERRSAASGARKGTRKAWLASRGRFVEMPVYDRYALAAGTGIKGPAIVEEASATMIVPPSARAQVDRAGNLIVDLGS
ncbi:MAG: hydantoinase/oxoprolinase family protein [Betaproteobacteria bacterium]|nr:hydantoinase/oxoprolinase family protein [Betaproteobacteria bacterium]